MNRYQVEIIVKKISWLDGCWWYAIINPCLLRSTPIHKQVTQHLGLCKWLLHAMQITSCIIFVLLWPSNPPPPQNWLLRPIIAYAGQKYKLSALLLTFIKLPFVVKTFVLSIFEWPFKTGFTVYVYVRTTFKLGPFHVKRPHPRTLLIL